MTDLKYAYFIGCVSEQSTKENDIAARLACEKLGIQLVDLDFSCCGAGVLQDVNEFQALLVNARNFALAEQAGLPLMTICSTCQFNLMNDNKKLKENPDLLKKVNAKLAKTGLQYKGTTKITHLLWVVSSDYGLDMLKEKVTMPLSSLHLAGYYGCQMLRPAEVLQWDNPDNPHTFEDTLRVLGCNPVKFKRRTNCCGFHALMANEGPALELGGSILGAAMEENADAVVTVCPLCYISLDTYRSKINKRLKKKITIPVLHFPQVLALALGIEHKKLGFKRHIASVKDVVKKLEVKS